MKRKIAATAVGIVLIGGLAACGPWRSGTALQATSVSPPPSAVSILQADGYTPDSSLTSLIRSNLGSAPGVSSFAAAKSGKGIQLVIVCTSPALASAAETAEKSLLWPSGITLSATGDVVTATGALSAWSAFGSR